MGRAVARPGRRAAPDAGAAAVEFALISVVLFTLLFGVVQYGFYFLQATSVTSLAAQAGRQASVRTDCTEWAAQVGEQVAALGNGAAVTEVRLEPSTDDRTGPTRRGDQETVTVVWDPTQVGVVPFPVVDFAEQTVVRFERLDVEAEPSCRWQPEAT